ncbi:MAG: EamA family transporter [Flavobacteriales bacterium]
MNWVVLAFLTAIFRSLADVFSKIGLQRADLFVVSWSIRAFSLPVLLPVLFFIEIPSLDLQFWFALLVGAGLNVLTTILYMRALQDSDLSVTVPMISFTPVFLLVTSPLMIGEFPELFSLLGVLFVVGGSYFLQIQKAQLDLLGPFKALFREKGPRLMLLNAIIWSVTANVDKIGIEHSSPFFWVVVTHTGISIGLLPIMLQRSFHHTPELKHKFGILFPIGLVTSLALICQMAALTMTLVVHVIAIKRVSTVLSVIWGASIFREKGFGSRMSGVLIMLLGVLMITLGSDLLKALDFFP